MERRLAAGRRGFAVPALHERFDKLAANGTVMDLLSPKPRGASDGQIVDRHVLS